MLLHRGIWHRWECIMMAGMIKKVERSCINVLVCAMCMHCRTVGVHCAYTARGSLCRLMKDFIDVCRCLFIYLSVLCLLCSCFLCFFSIRLCDMCAFRFHWGSFNLWASVVVGWSSDVERSSSHRTFAVSLSKKISLCMFLSIVVTVRR